MYKLLIVDDEPYICDGLFDLISCNFRGILDIYKCYSGIEVMDFNFDFDIVILDIEMPVISGIQVKDFLKEKNPLCRVIFLTGYNVFEYAYNAINSNNVKFLLKSESDDVILETIHKIIIELDLLNNNKINLNIIFEKSLEIFIQGKLDSLIYDRDFEDISNNEIKRSIYEKDFIFFIAVIHYINNGIKSIDNSFKSSFKEFSKEKFKFYVSFNNEKGCLIIRVEKSEKELEFFNEVKIILSNCKYKMEKDDKIQLIIIINKTSINFNDLKKEFQLLDKNITTQKYGEIIFYNTYHGEQNSNKEVLVFKVNEFINSNLEYSLNLPRIADFVGFNASYLSRIYKSITGVNISDYINSIKINRSKKLLENSNMLIKEVAKIVGFDTTSAFITFFKRYEGVTPKNYRDIIK